MLFRQLVDQATSTYTYLIADLDIKAALLVDPVLEQVERDRKLLKELQLTCATAWKPISTLTLSPEPLNYARRRVV